MPAAIPLPVFAADLAVFRLPASLLEFGLPILIGTVVGAGVGLAVYMVWKVGTLRRHQAAPSRRLRLPMLLLGMAVGAFAVLNVTRAARPLAVEPHWVELVSHFLLVCAIAVATWLVARLIVHAEQRVVALSVDDPLTARRRTTQAQMIRRVAVAIVSVAGTVAIIMTFPGARTAMTSVLASAGLISLVAGLAAQSSLANLFAGLQLAFTNAVRVGDTVTIESNTGKVEEVTLTYVVLSVWDGRHVVVPSTLFIKTFFETRSRHGEDGIGQVFVDVDWRVPVELVRAEARSFLESCELWDARECAVEVTDAKGGSVELRLLVSAATPGDVWKLRCQLREHVVSWLQQNAPTSLPRTRVEGAIERES